MKRVLVFDSECSLCTGVARKVCNEAGELIHDVWSLADIRTKEILTTAGMANLAKPAIIEITPEKTHVFAGPMFRWRMFRMLGPQRTLRLVKVIAGDLEAANPPSGEALRMPKGQSEAGSVFDRRRVLGLMTKVAASFVLVTGLGFSRFARAANKRRANGGPFRNLKWTADPRVLEGTEREGAWELFVNSKNIATLISSREFDTLGKAAEIRSALFSKSVPGTPAELGALAEGGSPDVASQYPFLEASERSAEGGRLAFVTTLLIERIILISMRLVIGEQERVSTLNVFRINPSDVGPPLLLAEIKNGRFYIKTSDFSAP